MNGLKLTFLGSAAVVSAIAAPAVLAGENTKIIISLDEITRKASGEPELFYAEPIALPEVVLRPLKNAAQSHPHTSIRHGASVQEHQSKPVAPPNFASDFSVDGPPKKGGLQDVIKHNVETVLALQRQLQDAMASTGKEQSAKKSLADILVLREKELAGLREQVSKMATISKNESALQQSLSSSEKENIALKAQLNSASEQSEEIASLKKTLTKSQEELAVKDRQVNSLAASAKNGVQRLNQIESEQTNGAKTIAQLQSKITELSAQLNEKNTDLGLLRQELDGSNEKFVSAEKMLTTTRLQLEEKSQQLAKRTSASAVIAPSTEVQIRDYALGALWAQEMQGLMREKQKDGYRIEREQVLSGATDFLHEQLKIPKSHLVAALNKLYTDSERRQKSGLQVAEKVSNKYIKMFSKQPGVKHSEIGYFYLIVESGKGSIKDSDTVAVVMRESLSDGQVINDMLEKHSVLSLPLNKFPPLFKSAIAKVKNHGEIHIVVPPELAYGEQGRSPDIPPNATMVYDIKVIDVNPGKKNHKAKS